MTEFKEKKYNDLEKKGKLIRTDKKSDILLEVKNLKTYFPIYGGVFRRIRGWVKAVDNVSFVLNKGEIFGLVGESGCGKTSVGRTLIRLYKPQSGELFFHDNALLADGKKTKILINMAKLTRKEMLDLRSKIQMIFQDPYSSLNPRYTAFDIIEEPLKVHTERSFDENKIKVSTLLEKVGLSKEHEYRFPHEFSGGQRQRIGIARALSTNPELIIADEPVSALDVSIQAQVINLIQDLQKEFKMTFLFIAHDLSVIRHVSHRIAVMYLGSIMEMGSSKSIYAKPLHPYTKALLSAVPIPDPKRKKKRIILKGDIPSPVNKPSGCSFHTRCPIAVEKCRKYEPDFFEAEKDHFSKCFFPYKKF
jgi:oligopeptide/dipeptide ABC transporter ATP-binding protein